MSCLENIETGQKQIADYLVEHDGMCIWLFEIGDNAYVKWRSDVPILDVEAYWRNVIEGKSAGKDKKWKKRVARVKVMKSAKAQTSSSMTVVLKPPLSKANGAKGAKDAHAKVGK